MIPKVLYVHNSLGLGGAQSVRYLFLKHLDRDLLDVSICCLGEKGSFGDKIERLGYRVDVFNQPYGLLDFSVTLRLYNYLKKNRFDIVHSSLFYANYHSALAGRMAKVPYLISEEHGEHKVHFKKRHFIYRLISRQVAGMSDKVLCCSDYIKQGVCQAYKIKEDKTVVLKNLIEDKRLEIKRAREEVRRELNIPADSFVMVNVASLYWIKNQKVLIDALRHISLKHIFLVLAGDGPSRAELEVFARKQGVFERARFLGWREDVADILNAADVFVLPSLSEGLPICLLEAMSVGLPCIASCVGGIKEILNDGVNGIMIRPAGSDDLIEALNRIINNRDIGSKMGLAARNFVADNFQPQDYIQGVLGLYNRLINK
ncbi:MAG: glycosyltransferase [Candidatus Omnitrophota bacterium]